MQEVEFTKEEKRYLTELRQGVREGKIKYDNAFYLFTTEDGLVVCYRGDFCPSGKMLIGGITTMEFYLKEM